MTPKSTRNCSSSHAKSHKKMSRVSAKKDPLNPPIDDTHGHDFDATAPTSHQKDHLENDEDNGKGDASDNTTSSPNTNKHSAQAKLNQDFDPNSYQC